MSELTKLEEELHSAEYSSRFIRPSSENSHRDVFLSVILTSVAIICCIFVISTYIQSRKNNQLLNTILTQQTEITNKLNTLSNDISIINTNQQKINPETKQETK